MGKKADRSEEIAFLVLEDVLGVSTCLADAGGTSGMVDGRREQNNQVGVVEVTGPPADDEIKEFAEAERKGELSTESGVDVHLDALAEHLSSELERV